MAHQEPVAKSSLRKWTTLAGWALLQLFSASPPLQAADVRVTLKVGRQIRASTEFRDLLVVARLEGPTAEEITLQGGVGRLGPGTWLIQAWATGYWVPEQAVLIGEGIQQIRLRAWPLVRVRGRLPHGLDSKASKPVGEFRLVPREPATSAAEVNRATCELEFGSSPIGVVCDLPATTLDVKIGLEGFAPWYWWTLNASDRESRNLGALPLFPGASIVGSVQPHSNRAPDECCRIELLSASGDELPARHGSPALSARPNKQGSFQLVSVPPGSYRIAASQGALRTSLPISVSADRELRLRQPIELGPPVELTVQLDPPRHPSGPPWFVQLLRLRNEAPTSIDSVFFEGHASTDDGLWRAKGLGPGHYLIIVEERSEPAQYASKLIHLEDSAALQLQIPFVRLVGSLLLDDEGLPGADLTFAGPKGDSGRSVTFKSDETGAFGGLLPQDENRRLWAVQVTASDPPVRRRLENVQVEPVNGEAAVTLKLPATGLRGIVLDADGNPYAAGSRVYVRGTASVAATERTIVIPLDKGVSTFDLAGLAPGEFVLTAHAEGLRSRDVKVRIREEEAPAKDRVELSLESATRLAIRILDSAGAPVPAARAKVLPAQAPASGAAWQLTGFDGTLDVLLPPMTTEVMVSVAAAGFAYTLQRLAVPKEAVATVRLSRIGGTIALSGAARPGQLDEPHAVLLRHGAIEWVGSLGDWAAANGGSESNADGVAILPRMAVGHYTVCKLSVREVQSKLPLIGDERCQTAWLGADANVEIELPR